MTNTATTSTDLAAIALQAINNLADTMDRNEAFDAALTMTSEAGQAFADLFLVLGCADHAEAVYAAQREVAAL